MKRSLPWEKKQYLPCQSLRCLCTVVGPVPHLGKKHPQESQPGCPQASPALQLAKCPVSHWGNCEPPAAGLARFRGTKASKPQIFPALRENFVLEIMLW